MATATVLKPKTVAKPTKAQKDAALRLKQAQRAAILLKQVSDPTRLQVGLVDVVGQVAHVQLLAHDRTPLQQTGDPQDAFRVEKKGGFR